ncbi:hypothetical protein GCM10023221_17990 [Luteimicrobium xylanilyticum]|uniref:Uncharacterized protein n=1 Tax=Luteimicrobium xylanilyticum TaxID=1133546 RepID=A0A5P9Q8G7_9MICO|nr:hypothetical protein [Luteimicrobium xylanilyticum]QFU97733.1 hypothetical protein KDY119_01232 [Luteimicrobium xylanilyticum]
MKRSISSALLAVGLAAGLTALPVAAANASGSTGSKTFTCPNGGQAIVTASATWQVTLTVNGRTASKSVATGGAVVTIKAGSSTAHYSASTAGPASKPSISISCSLV